MPNVLHPFFVLSWYHVSGGGGNRQNAQRFGKFPAKTACFSPWKPPPPRPYVLSTGFPRAREGGRPYSFGYSTKGTATQAPRQPGPNYTQTPGRPGGRRSPCSPPAGGGTPRRAREAKPRPAEGRRPPSRREGRRGPPRGGPAAPGRQGGGGRRGTRGSTGRSAHQAKAPTARAEPRRTASRPRGGGGATPGHATATPRPDPTGGPGRGRAIANPRRGPPMRPTFEPPAEAPRWGRARGRGPNEGGQGGGSRRSSGGAAAGPPERPPVYARPSDTEMPPEIIRGFRSSMRF